MFNFDYSWYFLYIATLFLFDISPGVSFVMTATNTIKNRSLKSGFFTALGVATSDYLSALIGFFFCTIINQNQMAFKILQIIGVCILFYFATKMLLSKTKELSADNKTASKTLLSSYKSGFVITFTNIGVATIIISVISQFYKYVNGFFGYFSLLISVPIVSFFSFFLVAVLVYFFKMWKVFGKYSWVIDKISGIVLIMFGTLNLINILK